MSEDTQTQSVFGHQSEVLGAMIQTQVFGFKCALRDWIELTAKETGWGWGQGQATFSVLSGQHQLRAAWQALCSIKHQAMRSALH